MTTQYNLLFRLASKLLKYFLLALVGFAIACVISMSLGGLNMIAILPFIADWILRVGLLIFCLLVVSIIIESLR